MDPNLVRNVGFMYSYIKLDILLKINDCEGLFFFFEYM